MELLTTITPFICVLISCYFAYMLKFSESREEVVSSLKRTLSWILDLAFLGLLGWMLVQETVSEEELNRDTVFKMILYSAGILIIFLQRAFQLIFTSLDGVNQVQGRSLESLVRTQELLKENVNITASVLSAMSNKEEKNDLPDSARTSLWSGGGWAIRDAR